MDPRPIGVFDSGIGGLTVLRALRTRLPEESFVYLGDTARVPYGTKGDATVQRFAREAARYLLAHHDVKRLVIACNTASALALDSLREECPVPVEGVIEPGVMAALAVTQGHVGVIGTAATVGSDRYGELLRRGRPDLTVDSLACPLFVPLAEEGWVEGDIARAVAHRYLDALREGGVDTLILGCTHYPVLKQTIAAVMGDGVQLVDSAVVLSEAVAAHLHKTDARAQGPGDLRVVVTDVPQRFRDVSARFLAMPLDHVDVVDLDGMSEDGGAAGTKAPLAPRSSGPSS